MSRALPKDRMHAHGTRRPRRRSGAVAGSWDAVAAIAAAAAVLAASCATNGGYTRAQTASMQHEALAYLAQGDPTVDRPQALATYTTADPGDAARIPRLFPGAPPQIPHEVHDLLPITMEENPCLGCHLPNTAGEDDIPIPASHFAWPQVVVGSRAAAAPGPDSHAMLSYVAGYAQHEDLLGARYNCVQCHTPRAENFAATTSAP